VSTHVHAQPTLALADQPSASRPLRVEIIALTSNDALLEQIGQALDDESTIRQADSLDTAREFIRPLRPCVLLLDAQGHPDIAAIVEKVQSPDGTCIVVVFSPADEIANVSSALRGSPAYAILPVPVERGPTIAVLEGAREEALARLTLAAPATAMPVASYGSPAPSALPMPSPARSTDLGDGDSPGVGPSAGATAGSKGGRHRRALALSLAGIAIVVIIVGWFTLRAPDSDDRTQLAGAPASTTIERGRPRPTVDAGVVQTGSSDELLEKAHAAMGARRYTDPEGDNALAYFRAVLAQDPANDEAKEGLQRIGVLLDERLQSEQGQRRFNDVAITLAQLQLIRPGDPGLAQIAATLADAQIAAAVDAGNVEHASQLLLQASERGTLPAPVAAHWRDEIGRRRGDAEAQRLAQLVSTRIREGKLVEPAADSAKNYLAQLRRMPSDPKGLADAASAKLQQAYLVEIREAAGQSRGEDLKLWVAEARALDVAPARLEAAIRAAPPAAAVPSASTHAERLAQLVQERVRDGRLLQPSQDSAVAYLSALRAEDPSGTAAASSTQTVSSALLDSGRKALAVRDFDTAQAYVNAARGLGLNMADVDALQRAISATHATVAARSLPPTEIKRTRYVPPEYPHDALKKGISGAVLLRITVAGDGKVKSATVVKSDPADVFDEAALHAARRWRFKPFAADDPDIEGTVMTNVVFRPDEVKKP
jgi:protein TonB